MVQELAATGKTVLLTTHNLQEAEEVCTRVAIIHGGRILAQDAPEALRALSTGLDVLEVTCERYALAVTGPGLKEEGKAKGPMTGRPAIDRRMTENEIPEEAAIESDCLQIEELVRRAVEARCSKCSVTVSRQDDGYKVVVKGRKVADEFPSIAVTLTNGGWRVTGFNVSRPRLEDVFVELTGPTSE